MLKQFFCNLVPLIFFSEFFYSFLLIQNKKCNRQNIIKRNQHCLTFEFALPKYGNELDNFKESLFMRIF